MIQKNVISWFEIPSVDLDRAAKFYENVFDIILSPFDTPNLKMRIFPMENFAEGVGGAVVKSEGFHVPSESLGPLLYLNANPDVQIVLDRVVQNGGTVLLQKTMISPENGYMGLFIDTEGNRIAVHSIP